MRRLRVAGAVALATGVIAALFFLQGDGQEGRTLQATPTLTDGATKNSSSSGELRPALTLEEQIAAAPAGNLLDAIPWGRQPVLELENTYATLGSPPDWELVQHIVEFGVRTGGFQDLNAAFESAQTRVRPRALQHLFKTQHPRFDEIKIIYDDFQQQLSDISQDWAEADLRYRDAIVRGELYQMWKAGEPQPESISINPNRSMLFFQGWTVGFTYERGISAEYDRVTQQRDDLIAEMHAEIDMLLHG